MPKCPLQNFLLRIWTVKKDWVALKKICKKLQHSCTRFKHVCTHCKNKYLPVTRYWTNRLKIFMQGRINMAFNFAILNDVIPRNFKSIRSSEFGSFLPKFKPIMYSITEIYSNSLLRPPLSSRAFSVPLIIVLWDTLKELKYNTFKVVNHFQKQLYLVNEIKLKLKV